MPRLLIVKPFLCMITESKISTYAHVESLKSHSKFWSDMDLNLDLDIAKSLLDSLLKDQKSYEIIESLKIPLWAPKIHVYCANNKLVRLTDVKVRKGTFGPDSVSFSLDQPSAVEEDDITDPLFEKTKIQNIIQQTLSDLTSLSTQWSSIESFEGSNLDQLISSATLPKVDIEVKAVPEKQSLFNAEGLAYKSLEKGGVYENT